MMQIVFTHVPAPGFSAFRAELSSGGWALVDTTDYEGPNRTAAKPLGNAPTLVVVKLRLTWGIAALDQAIEGAGNAKDKDHKWDGHQKHLNALIFAAASSNDPAKREAAGRLQKMLLLGAGGAQTKLRYQQEVDFGRKQRSHTSQGQGAADVALLGLGSVMTDIEVSTAALAAAIGYGESAHTPYDRKVTVTAACSATFAWAAHMLGWMAEHGSPGADREQAIALRVPLEELVARYPAPVIATKSERAAPAVS